MNLKVLTFTGIAIMTVAGTSAAHAATMGAPAGSAPLALVMKYHHAGDLETLIGNQTDPASPVYGKFLTPEEFRRYFAPTPTEYSSTVLRLRRAGFAIVGTSANRTIIDVAAPTALIERTFGSTPTPLGQRIAAAGATTRLYSVPADLPFVGAAVGLGTRSITTFSSHINAHAIALGRSAGRREHERGFSLAVGPDGGFGPGALIKGLDFPVRHGYDGAGIKVADIIDGAPVDADVQIFLNAFGMRRSGPATTVVPVDGGSGPDPELADIDAEWLVASAPGVSLYAYDMSCFCATVFVDALNQLVSDNIIDVVNTSLSNVESDQVNLAVAIQPIIAQGACQGIAFETVSFGGVNVSQIPDALFPLIPADSADELAVGGSNAIEDEDGEIIAQTGMPNSGGGISAVVPVFAAQQRLHGVDPSGRNVPDMSIVSEINGNGASYYIDGGWFGGLPFVSSTPMAGVLAEYQQMVHHRLGAFNRTLYNRVARHGYGDGILDITSGCNGMYLGGAVCAKSGYDLTSGIGAVSNAYRLGRTLR